MFRRLYRIEARGWESRVKEVDQVNCNGVFQVVANFESAHRIPLIK